MLEKEISKEEVVGIIELYKRSSAAPETSQLQKIVLQMDKYGVRGNSLQFLGFRGGRCTRVARTFLLSSRGKQTGKSIFTFLQGSQCLVILLPLSPCHHALRPRQS